MRAFLLTCLAMLTLGCSTVASTVTIATSIGQPAPSPTGSGGGTGRLATVTRVVDGDTMHVTLGGRDVTVRFIGVDTPETVAPGQPVECYGPESSRFAMAVLTGERVRLEFDVERIDPFGRTLAYVWMPDGSMFNETLVRRGFATVATYPPDTRYVERFEAAERRAKAADRGMWGAC
jgi:micrococcal nuclease